MTHVDGETGLGPSKKARAKKSYDVPTPIRQCYDGEAKSFVRMLNQQVFEDMSTSVGSNKSADLIEIIEFYTRELEKVIPYDKILLEIPELRIKNYPCYFRHRFSVNRHFTDSFLALASIFKINPLASKNDALSRLLDQEPECQESVRFAYISIQDVVKSKGNAIHGPKRENIGKFNRKLFETCSRELDSALQHKLVVNLKFYPNFDSFLGSDKVLSSDYVSVALFSSPREISIGEHILIIHKTSDEKKLCTIKNENSSVFTRIEGSSFCSAVNADKKRINLMYLPTLSLYSIEFLCQDALTFAYDLFFKDCQLSAATQ